MREVSGNEIWAKVREKHIPLHAVFELTYRCNLSCVHCFLEDGLGGELTPQEVCSVIDQLAAAGTLEITLTGGEALLREDFFDIAAHARRKNMAITLLSNGTLLGEPEAERIKELHFFWVNISLYGTTPEIHEAVTGKPGSFAGTVKAAKLLRQHGVKVQINFVAMKQNLGEYFLIDDFCQELGLECNTQINLFATTKGSLRPTYLRLDDSGLRKYLQWEKQHGKKTLGLDDTCNAGLSMVSISPQGKVFPCNILRLEAGDIRQQEFAAIWDGSPVLQWLRRLKIEDFQECSGCHLLDTCFRCPGQAVIEGYSMLVPNREICRISKMRHEVANEK
jgi:AdoMet-dependent heme synthase